MDLKQQRAAAIKAAQDIIAKAKSEERDLTTDEVAQVETHETEIKSVTEKIEAAEKSAATVTRLSAWEVKEPEQGGEVKDADRAPTGSVGERFVKSDAFQGFRKAHPSGVGTGTNIRIEAKGIGSVRDLGIGTKADITTQTGNTSPQREPGYRDYLTPDEPLTFLDLITVGNTDVSYSEYSQVVAETNNAAVVLEGQLKPLSDLSTAEVESKAYTYADGFVVTNQTLADDGALVAFMESRIRQHVLGVIEQKLFNGAGSGTEPQGIMTTTGTLSQAFSEDVVVTIARALETFAANNGNADPQAIVMNPTDVWNLRLLKGTDGHYLLGNPLQQGPVPTPWGVPLVSSNKLTAGSALVGRFDSVHYLELEALNVVAFNQHENFAQLNKSYVRAESRGRQLFYAPREVVVTDISAAA